MAVGNDWQAAAAPQKAETLLSRFAEYVPRMRRFLREDIRADIALVDSTLDPSWLRRESETVASLLALREPAYAVIRQAEITHERLKSSASGQDLWDESRELRCQLCFVAWRHALALGKLDLASQWWVRFQETFQAPWVGFDAQEWYAEAVTDASAGSGLLIDSYSLLSLSSWMRVELNRRDDSFRRLLPTWRRVVANVDMRELCPDERFALEAEFALIEAICHRTGGRSALAMSLVFEIEKEPQYDRLIPHAKSYWEAEKIACLFDLLECEAVVESAQAFLQKSHEETTSLARAKVTLSLGLALSLMGQYRESAAVLGKAVADPGIMSTPLFAVTIRQSLGVALVHSGNIVAGLGQLRRAGRLARSFRDCAAGAMFELYAAEALNAVGQSEESAGLLKAALSRLDSAGHRRWADHGRLLQAEVLIGLGRYRDARQVLLAAISGLRSYEVQVELRGAMQLLREVDRVLSQRDVSVSRRPGEPS